MFIKRNTWVVVLAAGSGQRLRALTANSEGRAVPKQYCSLLGDRTLLQATLARARAVAGLQRVCVIVAAQHALWWHPLQRSLAPGNLIVQPEDRGTAHGVLLPMLHILARDPHARILYLPSDHYVAEEQHLYADLLKTLRASDSTEQVCLLGFRAEHADPELGYIVPGAAAAGVLPVQRFVEKPVRSRAVELMGSGALWNSFIFAASACTLLALYQQRAPQALATLSLALRRSGADLLRAAYAALPPLDFCRDLLAGAEARLRVLTARACGWTDLGTPERVGMALASIESTPSAAPRICHVQPDHNPVLATAYGAARVTGVTDSPVADMMLASS